MAKRKAAPTGIPISVDSVHPASRLHSASSNQLPGGEKLYLLDHAPLARARPAQEAVHRRGAA